VSAVEVAAKDSAPADEVQAVEVQEEQDSPELRLAEALRRHKRLELEHSTAKKRGDELEAKWGKVGAIIEGAKSDPDKLHDLLELAGYTADQIPKLMLDKKLVKRAARAQLPPDVQDRIAALEEAAKKLEEREAKDAESAAKASDMAVIESAIESSKASAPLLGLMPGASDRVYGLLAAQHAETGETPDLPAAILAIERAILSDVKAILTSGGVQYLLSDESIRDTLTQALQGASKTTAKSAGVAVKAGLDLPRSLTQRAAADDPTRSAGPMSARERDKRVAKAARQVLGLK
jgi:CheY-like chemotaxis protein